MWRPCAEAAVKRHSGSIVPSRSCMLSAGSSQCCSQQWDKVKLTNTYPSSGSQEILYAVICAMHHPAAASQQRSAKELCCCMHMQQDGCRLRSMMALVQHVRCWSCRP